MALFSKKQPDMPRRRTQAANTSSERATESALDERYAFRRNRTLTGSSSSEVTSSNESAAHLKSPRVHAHELAQKRRHLGGILLFVITGGAALLGLISQFTASVVVTPQTAQSKADPIYEKAIQDYFSSRPIERLRFLIDAQQLTEYVQTKAPEVAAIENGGSAGFGASRFIAVMRKPIAGWSINGRQQYVDTTGTAFERNYYATPTVQIIDKSGVQVQAGQAVASNRFLGFVGRAVGLAKAQGYTVTQVIIPVGSTREVELRVEGVAFPIKLSVDREAGTQTEDMARVLRWLSGHSLTPEYLDVRISGKSYYK